VIALWRIAADTPRYTADDLSGQGALLQGGRWNEKGTPAVYVSSSIALACLETLVHLAAAGLPLNRYLVRIEVDDALWSARQSLRNPKVGWDAIPPGRVSIDAGQTWLAARASALLEVPSVVVPEEANVLLNPRHPDARKLRASKLRKWTYDGRFIQAASSRPARPSGRT
jgi:RES domain-containing protein